MQFSHWTFRFSSPQRLLLGVSIWLLRVTKRPLAAPPGFSC
jgi:hypothetical protein